MGMVGNPQDAQLIRDYIRNDWSFYDESRPAAPEGWEYLSSGVYRNCFVSPDNVVYKVDCYPDSGEGTNAGECRNLVRCAALPAPEHTRMPKFTYYGLNGDGVIAMERIHGTPLREARALGKLEDRTKFDVIISELERKYDLDDLHGANVIVEPSGDLVVVDWGL